MSSAQVAAILFRVRWVKISMQVVSCYALGNTFKSTTGSGYDFAPNRPQTIAWTDVDPADLRIYASSVLLFMWIWSEIIVSTTGFVHDDVIKWKHFPRYWPFGRGISGEFPAQRPVTRSFDVFFDLRPNKRLSKHWWGWWFETPPWSLWRHRVSSHEPSQNFLTFPSPFCGFPWPWDISSAFYYCLNTNFASNLTNHSPLRNNIN